MGALGSKQGRLTQPYIFSCLIARAECTRLCCRMLPHGSWQRLILKCQLLSRGADSNELPRFALVPGTSAPSPLLPKQQGNETPRKGIIFPSPEMKVKNFIGVRVCVRVCQHIIMSPNPAGFSPAVFPLKVCPRKGMR